MPSFQFRLNVDGWNLAHCSAVANGHIRGRPYQADQYRTTLSIKSVVEGAAFYRTRQGHYLVEDDSFLILNEGQEYWLDISPRVNTETLCPFLEPGLVEHVSHCLMHSADQQLDDLDASGQGTGFYERLYPKTGEIARRLNRIHRCLQSPQRSTPWLEDEIYGFAAALVRLGQRIDREVASFPGARASTRAELYRRLHRARDYIDATFAQPLSVAAIAKVACLSPYHFQRMFRQAFGTSPMQCLQSKRLQAASRLLTRTDRPITSICFDVGFESLGSFSWLFRKEFGFSPREYRRSRHPSQVTRGCMV
jgi:AraC family transcriptional regulator